MTIAGRQGMMGGKKLSAKSYIQDGLVAMWDGVENAGWGVHDANATAWKDLVGNCDLTLQGNAVFNDKGLFLDGASYAMREIDDSYWDTVGTLDVGVDMQAEGTLATIGGRGTDFALILLNRAYEGRNGVYYRRAMSAYGWSKGFRSVCRRGRYGTFNIFEDGLELASDNTNWANPVVANAVFIGASSPTSRLMKGVVHCVRVYNRALTDEEVRQNHAIDKERFGL